mgnify:CR=1 FL=1
MRAESICPALCWGIPGRGSVCRWSDSKYLRGPRIISYPWARTAINHHSYRSRRIHGAYWEPRWFTNTKRQHPQLAKHVGSASCSHIRCRSQSFCKRPRYATGRDARRSTRKLVIHQGHLQRRQSLLIQRVRCSAVRQNGVCTTLSAFEGFLSIVDTLVVGVLTIRLLPARWQEVTKLNPWSGRTISPEAVEGNSFSRNPHYSAWDGPRSTKSMTGPWAILYDRYHWLGHPLPCHITSTCSQSTRGLGILLKIMWVE